MQLIDLLTSDRVCVGVTTSSKKRLLEQLSTMLAEDRVSQKRMIFDSLFARERISSTGLGNGIAIPHGRIDEEIAPIGTFLVLEKPVDFDAPDGKPVDLVFSLVVPEHFTDDHLKLLAQVAEIFSNEEWCAAMRNCGDAMELYGMLSEWSDRTVAR